MFLGASKAWHDNYREWCITFEWEEGDALKVDLEQYH